MYAFIGWFLYVLWLGIGPTTLAYWDDALTNWATRPEPAITFFYHLNELQLLLWTFTKDHPPSYSVDSVLLLSYSNLTCVNMPFGWVSGSFPFPGSMKDQILLNAFFYCFSLAFLSSTSFDLREPFYQGTLTPARREENLDAGNNYYCSRSRFCMA